MIGSTLPCGAKSRDAHLITLDQTQQVFAQSLKNHADMIPIGSTMAEVVEEADDVAVGVGHDMRKGVGCAKSTDRRPGCKGFGGRDEDIRRCRSLISSRAVSV